MAIDYEIRVPMETTDEQLVEILRKTLPAVLESKFKYTPVHARMLAEKLAPHIVERARMCARIDVLRDQPERLATLAPTREQCENFRQDLDQLIKIRYAHPRSDPNFGTIKRIAGKLWALVAPEEERWDDDQAGGGPGVRG